MPVLPAVPSTMMPPGFSVPRSSASLMMAQAARSFTEPPGFWNSALPRISQPVSSESLRRRMRGVLPMAPTKPSQTFMGTWFLGRRDGCGGPPEIPPVDRRLFPNTPYHSVIQGQPLQGDHRGQIGDCPGGQALQRLGPAQHQDAAVLLLMVQPMNSA